MVSPSWFSRFSFFPVLYSTFYTIRTNYDFLYPLLILLFSHFSVSLYYLLIYYWWGHQDSNPDQQLRRMLCYPLHHTPSGEGTRIRTGITGFETPYAIHYTMPPNLLERNRTSGFQMCTIHICREQRTQTPHKSGLGINFAFIGLSTIRFSLAAETSNGREYIKYTQICSKNTI